MNQSRNHTAHLSDIAEHIMPGISAYGRAPVGRGQHQAFMINTSDIRESGLDISSCERVTVEGPDVIAPYQVRPGDVLINIRGTSFRSTVCPPEAEGFVASANVAIVRLRKVSPLGPHLLQAALASPSGQQALRGISQGSATLGIRPKMLGTLTFAIPAAEESARLEAFSKQHAVATRQAEIATAARTRILNSLTNNLIQA